MSDADVILVGGGLANTLIALRLAEAQPQLKLLMLEQGEKLGGNHTWSFHGSDLTAEQRNWIAPLIRYQWQQTEVRFPKRQRTLLGSYHSITSEKLDTVARSRIGNTVQNGVHVTEVQPDQVKLEDGRRLTAQTVIDGRGPAPNPHLDVRFQKFVGRVLRLSEPHQLPGPIIMDATQTQEDGYRFFYTLPFDAHTVLIEDTRYSDTGDISVSGYGDAINQYAAQQGWNIETLLHEEDGVLPITLDGDIHAFWNTTPPVPRSGLQAALFHPATGYSLPNAMRLADRLTEESDWSAANIYRVTRAASEKLWQDTGYYRALNRMLFLAADGQARWQVIQRFYGLNAGLIARFYAGRNTWTDT
jgi:lycopene beta-cyclase